MEAQLTSARYACRHCRILVCNFFAEPDVSHLIPEQLRRRFPWPGEDSFGIDAMFERAVSGDQEDMEEDPDRDSEAKLEWYTTRGLNGWDQADDL